MNAVRRHAVSGVDLQILEQRDLAIHVAASVSGDLDRLGIDSLAIDGWLTFTGIRVSLSAARSGEAASTRLQYFSDVTGLSCSAGPATGVFLFSPDGRHNDVSGSPSRSNITVKPIVPSNRPRARSARPA